MFFENLHNSLIFSTFTYSFKYLKSMKKLDSKQHNETLEEEVKRLRQENKKLSSKNDKQKDVIGKLRNALKKKMYRQ